MANTTTVRTERKPVSISDFAKEIVRLTDDTESINGMVYGDHNSGKTSLAATLPGRQFWLVCEPGFKVAGRRGATGGARVIQDSATANAAVDWLYDKNRYAKLDWLVLDGLSSMQDRIRISYTQEAFDLRGNRAHRNLPDKPDYFNTQNFLKSWIPQLVDMPVNLLITAHAYRTDKTDNGELLVFPGIQGKVTETANSIAGLMDFTGYLQWPYTTKVRSRQDPKQVKAHRVRRLWFETPDDQEDIRYICGDKFGTLGRFIDNPTMPKLLTKINGEENN